MEKNLGLYSQYLQMGAAQKAEVRKKRLATGKQIHLNTMQTLEEKRDSDRSERFAEALQNLIRSGMEESAAELVLIKNIELEEQREEKLAMRYEKQKKQNTSSQEK